MMPLRVTLLTLIVVVGLILSMGALREKKSGAFPFASYATTASALPLSQPEQKISAADQALAWSIFFDLAQSADDPAFGSTPAWQSNCDQPLNACGGTVSSAGNSLPQILFHHFQASLQTSLSATSPVDLGSTPPIHGDSVFYNSTALKSITSCVNAGHAGSCLSKDFGPDSTIMRVGWLKIERGSCHHISVFDQGGASDFKMNTVIVNTGYCKPSDNQEQKIVPLSEFFTVPIQTSAQVMAFSAEGGGTVLNIGDTALILGIHVIKKVYQDPASETVPHWVWSTFWWTNDPKPSAPTGQTGYPCSSSQNCPQYLANNQHWKNYVMNMVPSTPDPNQSFAPVANPYLDGKNAQSTNCVVCHSYAMVPRAANADTNTSHVCGEQDAQSLTPTTLSVATSKYQTSCTPTRVSTDGIWSFAYINKSKCSNDSGNKVCLSSANPNISSSGNSEH